MAHDVYANDHEVVAKAGDSLTVANFPDVCYSAPYPAKVGVPIPYPNTAFAKDAINGSRTVFIGGKEIMQRDKSFLRVSTGNEPATKAFKKGAITDVIKGKCYFRSWSMNVFVEGYNVCRDGDLTTNNHG
ncbi:DUF4150 domain-containing protein [Massilia genomosp. 1]|uniref:DUF4150 domain-containing protein n=1 Tax=Massilia genomosp. 1 TaxID=2609280 RepID=A0ABX0MV96_9BURK|nr:DUF4150 domain-containing protein [Massilia genomosp. 1]NHZ66676.1 DUF4150 domain-containing protein [Massilia genomosp. 1]